MFPVFWGISGSTSTIFKTATAIRPLSPPDYGKLLRISNYLLPIYHRSKDNASGKNKTTQRNGGVSMRSSSGMVKGVVTGMAVGAVAGIVGGTMMRNNKNIKKKAGKALKTINGVISSVQYMMK